MKRKIVLLAVITMSIACFASCEEEEPKLPHITQELYRGIHVGEATPIKGENLEGLEWTSLQYFVSEVDESQSIVAKHVGLAELYTYADKKLKIVAEVVPRFTDYDLPVLCETSTYEGITYDTHPLFGRTKTAYIKKVEKRTLDPRSKDNILNASLIYKTGNVASPYVIYSFVNGSLYSSGTLIDLAYISNLADFLTERYDIYLIDVSKSSAYFYHKVHTKESEYIDYVGAYQYDSQLGGLLLAFMDYNGTKSISIEDTVDNLAREIERILTQ